MMRKAAIASLLLVSLTQAYELNTSMQEFMNSLKVEAKQQNPKFKDFDYVRGEKIFTTEHVGKKGKLISCVSCHTKDLSKSGMNEHTNKVIEPLSPSANAKRLTDVKDIEKKIKGYIMSNKINSLWAKKIIVASLLVAVSLAAESDSYRGSYGLMEKRGVAPVTDKFYEKECSSCHFAYQPGLLPERSWVKVMGNLSNHFGTDASLEPVENKKILNYLVENSAEKFRNYKRSRKIDNSISRGETPIAVTQTRYFIQKHREIRNRLITQKEVGSLANCMSCHKTADRGSYSERDINIPNYGRWDDD